MNYSVNNYLSESVPKFYKEEVKSIVIHDLKRGLRNKCYKVIVNNNISYFVKFYNSDVRFSSFFNTTRCILEREVVSFLKKNDCSVPKVVYTDYKNEVSFFEYYEGINLRDLFEKKNSDEDLEDLIKNCIHEIIKMNKINLNNQIEGITFRSPDKKKYKEYFLNSLMYLLENLNIIPDKALLNEYIELVDEITSEMEKEKLCYGHFELHHDNILVLPNKIMLIDFEKFYPHLPQIDLISLLIDKRITEKDVSKYIEYYTYLSGDYNENFYKILDYVNIMQNLRMAYKILRNDLNFEVKWHEINGTKQKDIIKTDNKNGLDWNLEREEDVISRINNLFISFSNCQKASRIRRILNTLLYPQVNYNKSDSHLDIR